jgi:hypothetical protein
VYTRNNLIEAYLDMAKKGEIPPSFITPHDRAFSKVQKKQYFVVIFK